MTGSHFTLSPATKATQRVLGQRDETHTSADAQHHQHHHHNEPTKLSELPVKDANASIPAPVQRWTCANRIG